MPSKMDMNPTTEVDVRGETAMEAIMDVDAAIDNAVLMNINQLTIIHGKRHRCTSCRNSEILAYP